MSWRVAYSPSNGRNPPRQAAHDERAGEALQGGQEEDERTICAEFAGIGAVAQLARLPTAPCVLDAAGLIVGLVLAGSFHRVEHVLLALSTVLASYLIAGVLAHPDWSQAARGLVVPACL